MIILDKSFQKSIETDPPINGCIVERNTIKKIRINKE
jgi:hypothetical protein